MRILVSSHSSFISIVRALSRDSEVAVFDQNFKTTLSNLDISARVIPEFLEDQRRILDKAISETVGIIRGYSPNFSSNGISPNLRSKFEENILTYMYPRLGDLAYLVLALDEVKPDLIILHNDVEPMMRVAASWAAAKSVPCLHVPHALYLDVNRSEVGTDIHDIVTASHIAAYGPFQRDWYIERGAKEVRETGSPRFDHWVRGDMDRCRARRLLKVDEGVPAIVYAGTWRQDTNLLGCNDEWAENYENTLKAAAELEGARLIVKVHPNTGEASMRWHVEKAKELDVECLITPSHLEILVHAADLVYAPFGSNVLLEGTFVPGLRLMTTHGYENDDAVYKSSNDPLAIMACIKEALSRPSPNILEMQYKYLGVPDGRATERVIAFCEELLL